jgi:hypothetical protein
VPSRLPRPKNTPPRDGEMDTVKAFRPEHAYPQSVRSPHRIDAERVSPDKAHIASSTRSNQEASLEVHLQCDGVQEAAADAGVRR